MRSAILAGVLAALAGAARLQAAPRPMDHGSCGPAIAAAETAAHTAPGLLAAIGLVESGRIDHRTSVRQPWPWTVNAEGAGTYYPGKAEAILAVQALQARGVASIDVGCMQVNLMYHPVAFRTLDEAFDPVPNAAYAARFLSSLHTRTGAWPAAAAAYPFLHARAGRAVCQADRQRLGRRPGAGDGQPKRRGGGQLPRRWAVAHLPRRRGAGTGRAGAGIPKRTLILQKNTS